MICKLNLLYQILKLELTKNADFISFTLLPFKVFYQVLNIFKQEETDIWQIKSLIRHMYPNPLYKSRKKLASHIFRF